MIPRDAPVLAQSAIGSHLSERVHIYMMQTREPAVAPDFVIAAPDLLSTWPLADAAAVRAQLDRYLSLGYTRRFDEGGWVVLAK